MSIKNLDNHGGHCCSQRVFRAAEYLERPRVTGRQYPHACLTVSIRAGLVSEC